MNKTFLLIILYLLISHDSLAEAPSLPESEQWRKPGNDATNCAYMLLKFQDIPIEYQNLQMRLQNFPGKKVSLTDLRDVLNEYNVTARIVSSDPERVTQLPLPILIHVQNEGSVSGRFIILLGKEGQNYHIIEGGSVCHNQVHEDLFRRSWNGAALVLSPADRPLTMLIFLGALIGFFCARLGRMPLSCFLRRLK